MAIIGSSIGAAFALSFVAAPVPRAGDRRAGIFAMTGVLCIAAMGVVAWVVPDVPERRGARARPCSLARCSRDRGARCG